MSIELYHPLILAHNRKPLNFKKIDDPAINIEAFNPFCGDQYQLYPVIIDGILSEINFHGYGCAVSKAATSILTLHLAGKTIDEAKHIIGNYLKAVEGFESQVSDFIPFGIAKSYPARKQCAVLSWDAMLKTLETL